MKRLTAMVVAAIALMCLALPSIAQDAAFTVEFNPRTGDEGTSVTEVRNVPDELIGLTCELSIATLNNDSVHEGNTLTVGPIVIPDVEDVAGVSHTGSAEVTLGSTLEFVLTFGPDEITSLTLVAELECEPPVVDSTTTTFVDSTTTTFVDSTTITTVPTTVASTPPPTQPDTTEDVCKPVGETVPTNCLAHTGIEEEDISTLAGTGLILASLGLLVLLYVANGREEA